MDASIDTNTILYLYAAGQQDILFCRFDRVLVYKFIRDVEMENHAEPEIIEAFDEDVRTGKIEIITREKLKEIGMLDIFQEHMKESRILYDIGSDGEVYAVSLARTLGCNVLVTDDIKERGPHYTLMRMSDSEVMPLTFCELLLLDYLEDKIDVDALQVKFNQINTISDLRMDLVTKTKAFIRRFSRDPYSEKEAAWFAEFCNKNKDVKAKLKKILNLHNGNR